MKKPVLDSEGMAVDGLFNVWITLDNPAQYNSYTTEMVKGAILAFRRASNERDSVAVVSPGQAIRRSAPAATPRNMLSIIPEDPRSIVST